MNRMAARKLLVTVVALVLTSVPGAIAQAQAQVSQAKTMSIWQARRTITTKPSDKVLARFNGAIRFSADSLEYDAMSSKKVPITVRVDLGGRSDGESAVQEDRIPVRLGGCIGAAIA